MKPIDRQLEVINRVLSEKDNIPYIVMPFGKYKGTPLRNVLQANPQYLLWLYNNIDAENLPPELNKFIEKNYKWIEGLCSKRRK